MLAEIEKIQNKKASWLSGILVLGVSQLEREILELNRKVFPEHITSVHAS